MQPLPTFFGLAVHLGVDPSNINVQSYMNWGKKVKFHIDKMKDESSSSTGNSPAAEGGTTSPAVSKTFGSGCIPSFLHFKDIPEVKLL